MPFDPSVKNPLATFSLAGDGTARTFCPEMDEVLNEMSDEAFVARPAKGVVVQRHVDVESIPAPADDVPEPGLDREAEALFEYNMFSRPETPRVRVNGAPLLRVNFDAE